MKIKSACLIGTDTWFLGSPETPFAVGAGKEADETLGIAPRTYLQTALGKIHSDATLVLIGPDGSLIRLHSMYKNERCQLPDFWSNKVTGTYLTARAQNSDYLTWEALVELPRDAIHELLELGVMERNTQYDILFDAVFPKCSGERVRFDPPKIDGISVYEVVEPVEVLDLQPKKTGLHPRLGRGITRSISQPDESYRKYRSVLYIEPEERLVSREKRMVDVAVEVLSFLGKEGSFPQPHLLFDILLVHDIGIGVPSRRVAAVRLEPMPELKPAQGVIIPATVWDIVSCLEYIPQLKHMVKRLKMLPFYRSTLTEYVTRLSPYAVLTSYENIFLKDREEELTVRPHIRQLADEFHQAVSTNYLYLAEGTPSNKQIKVKLSSEGREYNDVLELIKEAFDQVYRDVKEISDQISARADAITNFLRDAATADSTRANLSLQESVKRLTVVTVLIAIITLVVGVLGVLPEEVRRRLFEVLLNILMECLERLF